jgi:hypothetical protein
MQGSSGSPPRRDTDYENRQRQLRMQVDSHGRNLADLQSRNKALAQQKQGTGRGGGRRRGGRGGRVEGGDGGEGGERRDGSDDGGTGVGRIH